MGGLQDRFTLERGLGLLLTLGEGNWSSYQRTPRAEREWVEVGESGAER